MCRAVHSAASLPAVPSVQSCTRFHSHMPRHLTNIWVEQGAGREERRVEIICLSCRMIFHYMRMVELLKLHHVPFNWRVAMSFVSSYTAGLCWWAIRHSWHCHGSVRMAGLCCNAALR